MCIIYFKPSRDIFEPIDMCTQSYMHLHTRVPLRVVLKQLFFGNYIFAAIIVSATVSTRNTLLLVQIVSTNNRA